MIGSLNVAAGGNGIGSARFAARNARCRCRSPRRRHLHVFSAFLVVLTLTLAGCRSGPPPTSGGPNIGLASKETTATGQYKGVLVFDTQCSVFSNEGDQVVCIANKGTTPVNIGGWLIRNTIGRTYHFPAGTTIDPGKTLKLHTGAGTNSKTDLYWNYQFKPVFDTSDQIYLVDDSDVSVATMTTPS